MFFYLNTVYARPAAGPDRGVSWKAALFARPRFFTSRCPSVLPARYAALSILQLVMKYKDDSWEGAPSGPNRFSYSLDLVHTVTVPGAECDAM